MGGEDELQCGARNFLDDVLGQNVTDNAESKELTDDKSGVDEGRKDDLIDPVEDVINIDGKAGLFEDIPKPELPPLPPLPELPPLKPLPLPPHPSELPKPEKLPELPPIPKPEKLPELPPLKPLPPLSELPKPQHPSLKPPHPPELPKPEKLPELPPLPPLKPPIFPTPPEVTIETTTPSFESPSIPNFIDEDKFICTK